MEGGGVKAVVSSWTPSGNEFLCTYVLNQATVAFRRSAPRRTGAKCTRICGFGHGKVAVCRWQWVLERGTSRCRVPDNLNNFTMAATFARNKLPSRNFKIDDLAGVHVSVSTVLPPCLPLSWLGEMLPARRIYSRRPFRSTVIMFLEGRETFPYHAPMTFEYYGWNLRNPQCLYLAWN